MPLITREDGDTRIVLGPGVADRLREFLGELDRSRAYLVTSPSVAAGPAGRRVALSLGAALVGTYSGSRPHVPTETVEEASRNARAARADVVIGLGGGSPIGTAKASVHRLRSSSLGDGKDCVVAAIPTTYAGSEVTPVFGTTDVARGRKDVIRSPWVRPRLALYDAELAVDTPPDLTASTGINALAHCVEGLYSKDAGEADRSMAVEAAILLVTHLPKAVAEPRNVFERYQLFVGSMEAGLVLAHAGMGVHHGLCHVLGGRYSAPHGVLNAIVLPHAMRFNLPVAAGVYGSLAPALGVAAVGRNAPDVGEDVCGAVAAFVRGLGLPTRLRDLGIPKTDLPLVAEDALLSKAVQANPRPVRDVRDALEILEAAW